MKSVFVDCDNTLVFPATNFSDHLSSLPSIQLDGRTFYVNTRLLNTIHDFSARGIQVVFWSAGGSVWVNMLINTLTSADLISNELRYEAICIGKPDWLFDDKQPEDYMPKTDYIEPILDDEHVSVTPEQAFNAMRRASSGEYNTDYQTFIKFLKEYSREGK